MTSLPILKRLWNRIRLLSRWDSHETFCGRCPKCLREVSYVNVGRVHWGFCERHKLRWIIGVNLFSSWHDETENDWQRNLAILDTAEDVRPYFPPATLVQTIKCAFGRAAMPVDDGEGVPF